MARSAAVCVLKSLRVSRASKAHRNPRTASGSASLDATPRNRSRTLSTVKSRTPSGFARSTSASLARSPSGRNATSIASGGTSTMPSTSRARAITRRLRRPGAPSPTSGTGRSGAAAVGCHNWQQAALGITPDSLEECRLSSHGREGQAPPPGRAARGNLNPRLRLPTVPALQGGIERQANPTDLARLQDDAAIRSGDRRLLCVEKGRREPVRFMT